MAKEKIVESLETVTKAQLIDEFKALVADAEALIKATAKDGSASAAKDRLEDLQDDLLEKGKAATQAADAYVHENPWKAVGIAAGVGLIVGLLISRR